MKSVARHSIPVFLFWLLFFAAIRPMFALWQPVLSALPLPEILQSMAHGLYMDFSMAGYFSIMPIFILAFRPWLKDSLLFGILKYYHCFLVPLVALLACTDLEIYHSWGHRLDSAILPYLAFPKEALASAMSSPLLLLCSIWILLSALGIYSWLRLSSWMRKNLAGSKISSLPVLVLSAACIIPIRGGFQLAPMNQSSVYFSSKRILNQAAENPIWVFCQSLLEGNNEALQKIYVVHSMEEANKFRDSLFEDHGKNKQLLLPGKHNVVLIVWESLSAKVAGCTNGIDPSTPNLDKMARKGLNFTNIYANGDRSDKGLVSILSATPAFGKISLMSHPNITAKLPFLNRRFQDQGYKSAYLYGGELEFANMKSYLLNAGFDKLIGKEDFPPETYNSKWGAHDEVVFDRQLKEADKETQPFFHMLFTLSSHEPFEVPGEKTPAGLPTDSLFCRAHRYTDRCLGNWVKSASKKPWWKNTLVIVVADHGHTLPGNSGDSDPEKYRIPMVWFGPALGEHRCKVEKLGNQTDLFTSLCWQMGDSSSLPPLSKNLLSNESKDFAMYAYRNGCSLLTPKEQIHHGDEMKPDRASLLRQFAYSYLFGQAEKNQAQK